LARRPGTVEQAKANPGVFANKSVGDVADYIAAVIGELDAKPAIVGHSFGGLLYAAGVVERTAADGSGPPAGTRVVGLVKAGAWAELAAISTAMLTAVPDEVPDVQAAALPTAGLTALRALEVAGRVLAKRMLITGATGGVGRFAIQLARESGAHITALVRDAAAARGVLSGLGASAVAEYVDGDFGLIIDAVGGATFGLAIEHVAPRGIVVSIGTLSDDETVSFRAAQFHRAKGATIYTLNLFDELAWHGGGTRDLDRLCSLTAEGRLDAQVELEGSWHEASAALDALLNRRIGGKAVLNVD
jgi:NADPH2:quinone reductase